MRKLVMFAAMAAMTVTLGSCALLSDEQKQIALDAIQKLVADGVLTIEQGAALKATIGGGVWTEVVAQVGTFVGSVVASLFGVRLWRGSIVERKGEPPHTATAGGA